jgi:hypothetical protein
MKPPRASRGTAAVQLATMETTRCRVAEFEHNIRIGRTPGLSIAVNAANQGQDSNLDSAEKTPFTRSEEVPEKR